ncbi:MAG: serine/threonine-protein kinase, partial [Acidobacteriota bacterium]
MTESARKTLGQALMNALELEGAEQRAFLEEFRARRPELADDLDAMLEIEGMKTDFLAGSAAAEVSARTAPQWTRELTPPVSKPGGVGRQIGPYKLVELLGSGGMGEVYLAEQKEPLERTVALKLVRTAFVDPASRARFEAEKQVLQRLEHPNIGRILDAGFTAEGSPFFALEVIEGEHLDRYCDGRSLTVKERLELMITVCRGIEHAHRRRIIHRDLKPSNILVAEIDGEAVPKVIDFGIAESLDRPSSEPEEGQVAGTPAYMSPEALTGSSDIDTRADVYSLGAVLYQLIVGRRPFNGSSYGELLGEVPRSDPPAPSTRLSQSLSREDAQRIAERRRSSLLELKRTLRGDLQWILLKAIAREADSRYKSVSALAADLRRFLDGRPISMRRANPAYRLRKWAMRNRWPVAAAGVLVAAAVGLAVQDLRSRARTEFLTQAGQELTRHIERTEWRLRVAHLMPPHDLTPELESIEGDMDELQRRLADLSSVDAGMAFYALGRNALSLEDVETARRYLERAWEEGYRRPEAALALGDALGRLYEDRLDAIGRIADRSSREKLRLRAQEELRGPALERLSEASGLLALPELLQARMTFYRDDLEGALELVRSVESDDAFEARFFEARLLQAMIRGSEITRQEVMSLFDEAEASIRRGLEVARSSPEGRYRLCRLFNERANYYSRYGLEGIDEIVARMLEACEGVRTLLPSRMDAEMEAASGTLALAEVIFWDRQENPIEMLQRLSADLEALIAEGAPADIESEARFYLGHALSVMALQLEHQGEDPRPAYGQAVGHLERSIELVDGQAMVHRELANAYLRTATYGSYRGEDPTEAQELAEQHARAAVALDPESASISVFLAQVQVRRAEHFLTTGHDPSSLLEAAESATQSAFGIDPGLASVVSTSAVIKLLQSEMDMRYGRDPAPSARQALERVDRMFESFPSSAYGHLTAGNAWALLTRAARLAGLDPAEPARAARESYGRGLADAAGLPGPHVSLATVALDEAEYALAEGRSPESAAREALSFAAKALEIDPSRHDAKRVRGEVLTVLAEHADRLGSGAERLFARASESLEASREQVPHDAQGHAAIARWTWRKASSGLGASGEERARGLEAAREALRLNG